MKSVDAVYKKAKLLRVSVKNREKIDMALERLLNIIFYTIIIVIILIILGLDPLALFLSFSSIILAFAFVVGSSAAKVFEGWLFILLQRPVSCKFSGLIFVSREMLSSTH